MRNFVLFSRQGFTSGNFNNLIYAGRLDLVCHCIISSFFLSHKTRKDVVLHISLNGYPNPPLYIKIEGDKLYNIRTDEETIGKILKDILSDKTHPGFSVEKKSFSEIIKKLSEENEIYVLEEKGGLIDNVKLEENIVFVLGDHIGLPKKDEKFVLRFGKKISLEKTKYLAADCITIVNYCLDKNL